MEKLNTNIGIVEDNEVYSSQEEEDYDIITTEEIEINPLGAKDNEHLLIGVYGNGSAFLKSSFLVELKNDSTHFKFKFMTKSSKAKTASKILVAELYQFEHQGKPSLLLLTKKHLTDQSYRYITEWISKNATYKRVAVFDSIHTTDLVTDQIKTDDVFCLKNRKQLQSNQFIRVKDLPSPNTIKAFAAYILTLHEVYDIPCVVYVAVTSLYDVCLDSITLFNECTISYAFLREKLSPQYLQDNKITNFSSLLKEYNTFKNSFYT